MCDKRQCMKKKLIKNYPIQQAHGSILKEPVLAYTIPVRKPSHKPIITKDFLYKNFKKIADKAPFTIGEWADILHISERTLHRYAKDNSAFNGMLVERILHIEKLIDMGNYMFEKEGFKMWLISKPFSLHHQRPIDLLTSYEGIQAVINLLGRMQHGIPA